MADWSKFKYKIYFSHVYLIEFLLLIVLGFLIGIPSGMFGFGGSSITTPLLRIFFGISPYLALASPLPMTVVSATMATKIYQKKEYIKWKYVWKLSATIIPGSIFGAYITKFTGGKLLMYLTAIFLFYVGIRFIIPKKIKIEKKGPYFALFIGFLVGFLSGMLANGGGIFLVPALVLLGLNLKNSIGTSMAIVLVAVIPSIIVHAMLGHIDLFLSLALSIGILPGTYLGSNITISLPKEKLRIIYGIFILLFAIYFAIFEIMNR